MRAGGCLLCDAPISAHWGDGTCPDPKVHERAGDACARCGENPAKGFAFIGDERYCTTVIYEKDRT